MKKVLVIGLMFALAGCGEAIDLQQAKQGAIELGGQALEAASGAVDTQTACVLAGQSPAFCGCLQERVGPAITTEHLEALSGVVRETLSGQGVETAAENAEGIDAATREALVQCATHAAIQGAVNEAGN